jgi:hypothetical protein
MNVREIDAGLAFFAQEFSLNEPGRQLFSAFSNDLYISAEGGEVNNWAPVLAIGGPETAVKDGGAFYIVLSDSNLVCSFINASFELDFEYNNGVETVTQHSIEFVNYYSYTWNNTGPYVEIYLAVGETLFGNVSLNVESPLVSADGNPTGPIDPLFSSNMIFTGLIGCDDFIHNWWADNSNPFQDMTTTFDFGGQAWMCRNKTIGSAIEDLAANITISMLGLKGVM